MKITWTELYDGWINYERKAMGQNNFKEQSVYRLKRQKNPGYIDDFRDALIAFWDWSSFKIRPMAYEVFESQEIQNSILGLGKKYKDAYDEIKRKFENGDAVFHYQRHLNEHLHVRFNYLYTHWDMRHLHLVQGLDETKSAAKCEYILIVRVADNKVYFIDVLRHTGSALEFHDQKLLTIVDNNWPDLLRVLHLPVPSSNIEHAPEDVKNIQKANYNLISIVNGKAVISGAGINGAGGRLISMRLYDRACHIFKMLECIINDNPPFNFKNPIKYARPIGFNSGAVIFDSYGEADGFMILSKSDVDRAYLVEFVFEELRLANMSETAKQNLIDHIQNEGDCLFFIPARDPDNMHCKKLN